jgi:acyl dehydratase
MSEKLHFEDFPEGEVRIIGEKIVDEAEVIAFARDFDPQPMHTDPAAAKASYFGGLIASGWHTCAMLMRIMCDGYLLNAASMGSPGVDSVRWIKPVRPGDRLTVRRTTLSARASASRPEMGIVKMRFEVINQAGEVAMEMIGNGMFRRRGTAAS